jgi:hypothetical protein
MSSTEATKPPFDMNDLIQNQNRQLIEQKDKLEQSFSTDNQKTVYQTQYLNLYKTVNFFLFYIYLFAVCIVAYFLYKAPNMNVYMKIVYLALYLAYPFVIGIIETTLYDNIHYVKSLMMGKVYSPL